MRSRSRSKQEIRALLIEHEFSRRIALQIKKHVKKWENGEDEREPETDDNLSHQPEYQTQVSIASSTCIFAALVVTPSKAQISSVN